ncbi:uncharacterized protein LOC121854466 [Homarus americanus]|uniref:uncharacterized protein LOC121854466 n=1 Tax=Homarus americanus TaxID=6706 RepID=UPI001C44343D|nr:uncharacterized protein LOC121854466 [Homarus americanus]
MVTLAEQRQNSIVQFNTIFAQDSRSCPLRWAPCQDSGPPPHVNVKEKEKSQPSDIALHFSDLGMTSPEEILDICCLPQHELVVAAEAAGRTVHSIVQVTVADVNDNAPRFRESDIHVAVVEEDDRHLPATIFKVEAIDPDTVDSSGLVYSVGGDGVDGHSPAHAYFTINPHTGHLLQLRALDRDPPLGRETWRVKVQVRDGQRVSPSLAAVSRASRRPRVTHAQHRYSHHAKVSPEATYIMPQEPSVPVQGHYFLSRYPQVPGESQHFLSQEPSGLQGQYFLSQDLLMSNDDGLVKKRRDKEMKEGRHGAQVQQNTRRKEKQEKYTSTEDRMINEEDVINQRYKSERSGKTEGTNFASKFVKKKGEFIQKKRRTAERKRKLRDKNHRKTKEETLMDKKRKIQGGRQSSDVVTRRLELHNLSSRPGYRSEFGGRKVRQKLIPLTWGSEERQTSLLGDQHSGQTTHIVNTSLKARPLRLKYLSHRKHQPIGVQRKLLSVRGVMKLKAPKRDLGGKINVGRKKTPNVYTAERARYANETLSIARPHEAPKNRDIGKSSQKRNPGGQEGSNEPLENKHSYHFSGANPSSTTASRTERDLGSTGTEGGGTDSKENRGAIDKRETGQLSGNLPHEHQMPLNFLGMNQLLQDRRYVKRFGAEGGGCEDYGVFNMGWEETEKKEPSYMREMRRDQVHVAETVVTVVVKDINDNAPVFPNATIYGEVQENGPIDLSVGVVTAWDADDQQEGTNAHLTYSIEKNVIDERSGQAIFTVNPETGLVRTAICCLDRETTPEYHIQVVAVDGGGLKGTGTVVVRLADVNDNSPRLTRDLWQVEVDETWGDGAPTNHTLLQISTTDHDTSNYFFYRVVEASGWGWQHFGMRTEGTAGHLVAIKTLDYEDQAQRQGFRFMVQVTDRVSLVYLGAGHGQGESCVSWCRSRTG